MDCPGPKVPTSQVTTPALSEQGTPPPQETKVKSEGTVDVIVTPLQVFGPFVKVTLRLPLSPTNNWAWAPVKPRNQKKTRAKNNFNILPAKGLGEAAGESAVKNPLGETGTFPEKTDIDLSTGIG
jgi:hypothetical protein